MWRDRAVKNKKNYNKKLVNMERNGIGRRIRENIIHIVRSKIEDDVDDECMEKRFFI